MKLCLSREYMSESYDQARRYATKWPLIERAIATVFIASGVGLYLLAGGKTSIPAVLVLLGFFELSSDRIKKHFWLRRHASSKLSDAEVEIEVTDSGIRTAGPHSNGHFAWSGIEKVVRTPKGILVWPQKGMYWYLPERVAGKTTIDFIQARTA